MRPTRRATRRPGDGFKPRSTQEPHCETSPGSPSNFGVASIPRCEWRPGTGRTPRRKKSSKLAFPLDADAKQIMQQKHLSYNAAFKEAQLSAPSLAHVYSHGVKMESPDVDQLKYNSKRFVDADAYVAGNDTAQSPITVLANVATSLKLADGAINWPAAAAAVNDHVDEGVRKRAATESLEELAKRWPQKSRDEIEREHRSLAAAALTGVYTEESLRDLLWSLAR